MDALPPAFLLFLLISSSFAATSSTAAAASYFNRSSFPPDFLFGAATSAYQVEGAASEGGKGPSIWDTYTHKSPENIADGSNGDVAIDFYHRYKDDVKLMKYLGLNVFRMSISWARILPTGKLSGGVNKEGIDFYNNVFNELLANGIIPYVTLFHWDVPQGLEDEYLGFLSSRIVDDFKDFADICFKEFGDRIKYWTSLNEPFTFSNTGYDGNFAGNYAPGRCSDRATCDAGDSATEPYIVAHNLLLSHAIVVKLYRDKYQKDQKGEIGITLVTNWFVPYTNSSLDAKAAQRALDFMYGWFMNPVVFGDYPSEMRSIVKDRLPLFSKEESELLKGSLDFLGLNYYTGNYAAHVLKRTGNITSTSDNMALLTAIRNGVPIGDPTGVPIFYVYPKGLHDILVYTKNKYNNPKIYITENGIGDQNNGSDQNNGTIKQLITDPQRIDFYTRHLRAVQKAIEEGVNVKGYMAWSFTDSYEWDVGYTQLFGFYFVDRKNDLKRYAKLSALWFRKFLLQN